MTLQLFFIFKPLPLSKILVAPLVNSLFLSEMSVAKRKKYGETESKLLL